MTNIIYKFMESVIIEANNIKSLTINTLLQKCVH